MKRFEDRIDAGQQLAEALKKYQDEQGVLILALPRGGVPVAYEIASILHLPMTVFIVRKLGVPGHEELAMGALAEENICIMSDGLVKQLGISDEQVRFVVEKEKEELKRRIQYYRQAQALPSFLKKTIILVDDGIATGSTMKAAIIAIRTCQPKEIILAVPVASQDSLSELSRLVDKVVCLMSPEPFYSVGQWYEAFPQTSDEDVIALLEKSKGQKSE